MFYSSYVVLFNLQLTSASTSYPFQSCSRLFPVGSLSLLQYVLAVGSSVFGAMFYGDLAEGQSEIHIPDVEPAAFLILLRLVQSGFDSVALKTTVLH